MTAPDSISTAGPGRGFPQSGPWVSYYGSADNVNLHQVANTFRIINIDADPDRGQNISRDNSGTPNFTAEQIDQLKANGRNRVISYLNLGAVERWRAYWPSVPAKAQLGDYVGYPDEVWMNVGDPDWQQFIVGYLAPRLVAQRVDGFYFDNLEIVEHTESDQRPFCDDRCVRGGLHLVARLRSTYPNMLFVMQNATSNITRLGTTDGSNYAALLDGIAHEEVFTAPDGNGRYKLQTDDNVINELVAWRNMNLTPGGQPLWIATEDYVNDCTNTNDAQQVYRQAQQYGFSPYVSDASAGQNVICYWPFNTGVGR